MPAAWTTWQHELVGLEPDVVQQSRRPVSAAASSTIILRRCLYGQANSKMENCMSSSLVVIAAHGGPDPAVWSISILGFLAAGVAYLRQGGSITISIGSVIITIRGRRRPRH